MNHHRFSRLLSYRFNPAIIPATVITITTYITSCTGYRNQLLLLHIEAVLPVVHRKCLLPVFKIISVTLLMLLAKYINRYLYLKSWSYKKSGGLYRYLIHHRSPETIEFVDCYILSINTHTCEQIQNSKVSNDLLLVAYNARFDRPFFEKRFAALDHLAWVCSVSGIDWKAPGFESRQLEYLLLHLG